MDSPTSITDQTPKEKPIVITSSNTKNPNFKFSLVNPKILGAMTLLLLLIGGIGTGVYLIQSPQQTTSQASLTGVTLSFKPAQIPTTPLSQFSVDVFADAGENKINSADLNFKYDPDSLDLKSISPGQILPKILVGPKIEAGNVLISLGTDGNSGVTGSGIIASLVFEVKQSDSLQTEISFDQKTTVIKVLNRAEGLGDIFGKAEVTISPSPILEVDESTFDNSATPAANNAASVADFNNDGLINSIDLSIMYAAWGEPESDIQKKADLNNDDTVNGLDYSTFLPKFKR